MISFNKTSVMFERQLKKKAPDSRNPKMTFTTQNFYDNNTKLEGSSLVGGASFNFLKNIQNNQHQKYGSQSFVD